MVSPSLDTRGKMYLLRVLVINKFLQYSLIFSNVYRKLSIYMMKKVIIIYYVQQIEI